MTKIIKVLSAAVSQTGATFYDDAGNTHVISITDPRINDMVDKVLLAVSEGRVPVEVDMTTYSVFDQIEKESGGMLKFFRVAKKKLASILGIRAERGNVNAGGFVESVPTNQKGEEITAEQPGTDPVTPEIVEKLAAAQSEAETKALSVEDTTVVAVVGDTPIVGAEALEGHAKAAVASGETLGFRTLVERLGAVAKHRKHSVQEALVFLKEMDLPFANDGSILAYKSLSRTSADKDVFIDNHSRTLKQGLGTFVEMDVELVDDNRRVLCSNGLHVARRGYLQGYGTSGGNVVCLIKIAPEDVISVPMGEQSKMRVRAYHIVAVLSDADMNTIRSQKSFTLENMDQAGLLAKVIRGDHVGILNRTTQHVKGKVDQMVPVAEVAAPLVLGKEMAVAHTVDVGVTEDTAQPIDVKGINEKLKETSAKPVEQTADGSEAKNIKLAPASKKKAKEVKPSEVQKILKAGKAKAETAQAAEAKKAIKGGVNKVRQAYDAWNRNPTDQMGEVLKLAKKSAKKSWEALGFSATEIAEIKAKLGIK